MMRGGGGCFLGSNPKPPSSSAETKRCVRFPTRSLPFSGEYAVLGLTPLASKSDVKQAYRRLALKYHPDVTKGDNAQEKQHLFQEIKSAYESLMDRFKVEEELQTTEGDDEYDDWEEWMGFEGGMPVIPVTYNPY
ncbi:hypothetical protein GIB67_041357 [Kingdonia uniflora]|uniref:J domain-containing protein n=1 Tax=Kingdonia uniflora TaxID=39325 RepID=A0A7J7NJE0_9MAGN|nr:hypothetical protein GIB67_041357 [Kingdonia uniflora]